MMKWLIVNSPIESRISNDIMSFLVSHQIDTMRFECSGEQSGCINDIYGTLQEITHIILLLNEAAEYQSVIQYISGYTAGRDIPLYIVGKTGASVPWNLQCAVICPDPEVLKEKLENNFDYFLAVDEQRRAHKKLYDQGIPLTSDCLASFVTAGDIDTASMFLTAGISVNARDSDGTPMLCVAARAEQTDMINLFITKGADIDAVSSDRGYSAVMDAVWKSRYEMVKILVDAGANLNFVSRDGQTALVLAVGAGNEPICELLSTHGADVNMKDRMGMSALDYAKLFKKENLVSLFTAAKG
ncbi:MAG: ankyrin repeat domain-containing protein [Spirochaetaceae bacterium]|jgi:hypothetical protein|nr:ankyrin repeat domain-containing protein [Spirochaetaceae bacterium]